MIRRNDPEQGSTPCTVQQHLRKGLGTWEQRALNGASSDYQGPESYDGWQPKDRREQQQEPEALPESR